MQRGCFKYWVIILLAMQENFLQLIVFFFSSRTASGNLCPQIISWIGFLQTFISIEKL